MQFLQDLEDILWSHPKAPRIHNYTPVLALLLNSGVGRQTLFRPQFSHLKDEGTGKGYTVFPGATIFLFCADLETAILVPRATGLQSVNPKGNA